jgi:hypothetical protein
VFAGIIFAAELGDAGRWVAALTAFVAYLRRLVNDVRDVAADCRSSSRLRPERRRARSSSRSDEGGVGGASVVYAASAAFAESVESSRSALNGTTAP